MHSHALFRDHERPKDVATVVRQPQRRFESFVANYLMSFKDGREEAKVLSKDNLINLLKGLILSLDVEPFSPTPFVLYQDAWALKGAAITPASFYWPQWKWAERVDRVFKLEENLDVLDPWFGVSGKMPLLFQTSSSKKKIRKIPWDDPHISTLFLEWSWLDFKLGYQPDPKLKIKKSVRVQ